LGVVVDSWGFLQATVTESVPRNLGRMSEGQATLSASSARHSVHRDRDRSHRPAFLSAARSFYAAAARGQGWVSPGEAAAHLPLDPSSHHLQCWPAIPSTSPCNSATAEDTIRHDMRWLTRCSANRISVARRKIRAEKATDRCDRVADRRSAGAGKAHNDLEIAE